MTEPDYKKYAQRIDQEYCKRMATYYTTTNDCTLISILQQVYIKAYLKGKGEKLDGGIHS